MLNFGSSIMYRVRGFSLVELMISMTIGLGVMAGLASYTASSIGHNAKAMTQLRLQEELNTISIFLSRELQRAGALAQVEVSVKNGAKAQRLEKAIYRISHYPGEIRNSCIMFAYDRDWDGQFNTLKSSEYYGFRLKDKAIEYRINGAKCDVNGWQDLSDSSVVEITRLQFKLLNNSRSQVLVTLAGRTKHNKNNTLEMSFVVRATNHG